jgi:hypothetical protein
VDATGVRRQGRQGHRGPALAFPTHASIRTSRTTLGSARDGRCHGKLPWLPSERHTSSAHRPHGSSRRVPPIGPFSALRTIFGQALFIPRLTATPRSNFFALREPPLLGRDGVVRTVWQGILTQKTQDQRGKRHYMPHSEGLMTSARGWRDRFPLFLRVFPASPRHSSGTYRYCGWASGGFTGPFRRSARSGLRDQLAAVIQDALMAYGPLTEAWAHAV